MAQGNVGPAGQVLAQLANQTGFADPRLARDQRHLTLTSPGAGPAIPKNCQLGATPDEGTERGHPQRLESALRRTRAEDGPCLHWVREPLEPVASKILKLEQATEQLSGARSDHNRARRGESLKPRSNVGRVPDYCLFLRRSFANEVTNHDQAGGNADPRSK